MEFAMLDGLVHRAKQTGLKKIVGYYYPTAKNNMVRDFYDRMGFTKVSEDAEGNTVWEFDLTAEYINKNIHIDVN
ncbi:MAG: HAD family hydrolase, partial [Lachnospiraceae bacterium]|nr:HAD family hydrolase [Lachnospiraceae bacterium]